MGQPVVYQTLSNVGVDPTTYYTVTASVTPETPAPPFIVGTRAFGSDQSEFVFVQCNTSTAINLGDFVVITVGPGVANATTPTLQANSASSSTGAGSSTVSIYSSLIQGFGATGLIVKQSVTTIPTGSYFWACTKGYNIPAITSNGLTTYAGAPGTQAYLYISSVTAGVLTSVISSLSPGLQGVVCINSLTTGISASIIPPTGTLLSGLTQGPVVNIYGARTLLVNQTLGASAAGASGAALDAF